MSALDVFAAQGVNASDQYTRYEAQIVVRDKLVGGIPKDPDTIKKWLISRLEIGDRQLIEMVDEIATQMQADRGERPSADELVDVVAREVEMGNGFKTVECELVYEARCMKAAFKEACNVAYPGTTWPGKPAGIKKGLMRYLAERVFVEGQYIGLGVASPTDTEQRIKHIMTPQGPRSAINVVDYVEQPKLTFVVKVLDDFLPPEAWLRIWECAQEIGIGADRARSDGRFDLVAWRRL